MINFIFKFDFYFEKNKNQKSRMNRFQRLTFLSNLCVSYESTICANRLLNCLGPDSVQAYNYIGKDIIGQTIGMYFVNRFKGLVDANPKRFLWCTNILQQTSFGIDLLASVSSTYYTPLAITASIGSNISCVNIGALNAKSIQRLSKPEKIGESFAEITMLITVACTIGSLCGLFVNNFSPMFALASMPFVGIVRIFTLQKAMEITI